MDINSIDPAIPTHAKLLVDGGTVATGLTQKSVDSRVRTDELSFGSSYRRPTSNESLICRFRHQERASLTEHLEVLNYGWARIGKPLASKQIPRPPHHRPRTDNRRFRDQLVSCSKGSSTDLPDDTAAAGSHENRAATAELPIPKKSISWSAESAWPELLVLRPLP